VGVCVSDGVGVGVGVLVGVEVRVSVGVRVGVWVIVLVSVGVCEGVAVGVKVRVGVRVTQTPVPEIVSAAAAHRADIVALSFSAAFPRRRVAAVLEQLREALPHATGLWAGGAGVRRVAAPAGVELTATLDDAIAALGRWRGAR